MIIRDDWQQPASLDFPRRNDHPGGLRTHSLFPGPVNPGANFDMLESSNQTRLTSVLENAFQPHGVGT